MCRRISRSRRRGVRARWQHHAAGARSLEGIDVVVHRVADGDGNRLLAVEHVQHDVAGRTDLDIELVDEVSSGVPDVVADRFLAGPGVRDPDTTHANMVPGYNLPTAKCKHGKPGTRNTSKQF